MAKYLKDRTGVLAPTLARTGLMRTTHKRTLRDPPSTYVARAREMEDADLVETAIERLTEARILVIEIYRRMSVVTPIRR